LPGPPHNAPSTLPRFSALSGRCRARSIGWFDRSFQHIVFIDFSGEMRKLGLRVVSRITRDSGKHWHSGLIRKMIATSQVSGET
jgi:hypothetical protein